MDQQKYSRAQCDRVNPNMPVFTLRRVAFLMVILTPVLFILVDSPSRGSSPAGEEGCLNIPCIENCPCVTYRGEADAGFSSVSKWHSLVRGPVTYTEAAELEDNSVFVYSDIGIRGEKRETRGIRRPRGNLRYRRAFEKGISAPSRSAIPYAAKEDASVETEALPKNREAGPSSTQDNDAEIGLGEELARQKAVRRFIPGPFPDVHEKIRGVVDSSGPDDYDISNPLRHLPPIGDKTKPSLILEGTARIGELKERISSFHGGNLTLQGHPSSRSTSPVSGARTRSGKLDDEDEEYGGDMGYAHDYIIPELGPLYLKGPFDGAHIRPSVEQLYDSLHLHVNAAAKALELDCARSSLDKPAARNGDDMLLPRKSRVAHSDRTNGEQRGGDGVEKGDRSNKQGTRRLFDAWKRVSGRFLNVVSIVNVDGFLLEAARFPRLSWTHRYGRQRLPVGTPYPGMAQLVFLLSLGPHDTAPNGQPSPRVVFGEEQSGNTAFAELWRGATFDAAPHGISLWPLKPVMLASRPSRFPLFRRVFRPHVFYAQLNELIDRATKQMLHLRCISTLRRDCWSVEQRWEWGRRSGISLFKSLTAGSRLAAKASCVVTELLTRMNKNTGSAANVRSRLRTAMRPLYAVDMEDQTFGNVETADLMTRVEKRDRSTVKVQDHLTSHNLGKRHVLRNGSTLSVSKQYGLKALPPWCRGRGWNSKRALKGIDRLVEDFTTPKQSTTSGESISVGIQNSWESKGRQVLRKPVSSTVSTGRKARRFSMSTKEIFYKFYKDPGLEEPFTLMGDDSPEALNLNLGLSLLAAHKTAAVYVHVSADENRYGEAHKNREHLLHAFQASSYTTDNGMTVPLFTLEFDVEVDGSHEDTVRMVAALSSAYSRVAQSQLAFLSEDLEGRSHEVRTVNGVAQSEISLLITVGQELGKFIEVFLFQFYNCKATRKLRPNASHESGLSSNPEYPQGDLKHFNVESVLNAMRTDGSVPCHLPLLILKPRFVVHKRHPVAVRRHRLWQIFRSIFFRPRSRFGPSVRVLPVISEEQCRFSGNRDSGGAYVGARARKVPHWILEARNDDDHALGIPVIMFRTPVHALAQSWLTGIVELRDVFRGSSAVVQDMRSMLPVAHPSRFPLYQDVHDDLLYMLGITANRGDVLPADAQAAALLVHLIHLRERSVTVPSHSFVRSPSFDSAECHRNFEPVRLELAAWESLKDRRSVMSTSWKSASGAPGKTARFDKEISRGVNKKHVTETYWDYDGWVPPGSREPPWDSINDVMIRLLAKAPRQFLGRVEKAAADLATFFCSHVPFVHFMQAAGSSEFTKFTLELAMRLQVLRREVRATVLSLTEARSPLRSQIPKPASLRSSVSQVHVGVRKTVDDSQSLSPIADIGGERSNEYFGFSDDGELRSRRSGSNLDLEPSRLHWRVGRDLVERRRGHVLQSLGLFAQESVDPNARSALEIVDLQLQIQNQVAEIASGLAADVAVFAEDDAARTEFFSLVQATPELQEQLELEKLWALEQQTFRKGVTDDTCLSRYGRQYQRRQVLENILLTRQPKTASFACSLLDAAEWLHSLKEDGRKLLCVSAPQSGGSDRRRFGVTNKAHFFHWLRPLPNRDMLNKRGRGVDESEIYETLEDAFKFARKFRKDDMSLSRQPGMVSLGNVSSRVAPDCLGGSSKYALSSDLAKRSNESPLEISAPHDARRHSLWWERIATSDASRLGLSPMAASVVPHLNLLLQSGLDWDCLGEDYPEANALWLFVMGRLCINSFFCEGMSSLLFGEGMLLPDMLRVARRAASRGSDPLGLHHLDVVLDGRHEGFARTFYVRERSGGLAGLFGSRASRTFPQDVFLSCSTEWIMAVETLVWVQSHPNCFMKFASL